MRLVDALRIHPGDVVAFVGAGGKSSTIRALVNELTNQTPVLVTTTTKLSLDQTNLAQKHLVVKNQLDQEYIRGHLENHVPLLVTKARDEKQSKWLGFELEEVRVLASLAKNEGAILLIEADGARGRSLKAPADYEPVLPEECDLVVPIVGLDVIGEVIPSSLVHRQEMLKELLGLVDGDEISAEHVLQLIQSDQAGLKSIPDSATIRVILNKVDSDLNLETGRSIAERLVKGSRIQSVLLASVVEGDPVQESINRIAGVVLSAGRSSRLEGLKQLYPFRGRPMVHHAIEAAIQGELDPVIIVIGSELERMRSALRDVPIQVVENPQPDRGQSSSIKVGMEAVSDQVEAVIFLLADMPLVSADLIRALVSRHQQTLASIIVPTAGGRRGNPVLFDSSTFQELMNIDGDRGGRAIFNQHQIEFIEWDETIHFDVDSEDDLSRLREIE